MRRPKDRAETVVRTWTIPTIATAFETYPELAVADVLDRCAAALTEKLLEEFREERQQQLNHEIRTLDCGNARRTPSRQIKDHDHDHD
jgi:hypothetical protein